MRTDEHNNPTAMTTEVVAKVLVEGKDFTQGAPFTVGGKTLYTARLLGDPIALTIQVINALGFFTRSQGRPRWDYIGIPKFVWNALPPDRQRDVIGEMYRHEGGTALRSLFPNFGKLGY